MTVPDSATATLICQAIQHRQLIEVIYGGGPRVIEPHCFGLTGGGRELLLAYQVEGYSESGAPEGWKYLATDRLEHLKLLDRHFESSRPGYNPEKGAIRTIHCSL
jgi:hypothetical protein